jgi:peptidyl-prolyl cis-trans isomerase C
MLRSFTGRNIVLDILLAVIFALGLQGCGASPIEQQTVRDTEVLARINAYRMTAADFKDGVDFILATKYLSVEPDDAKKELLDELITRNVLLQEAQRQNLDKQKAFMKEIERYWEQSLLKLLLQKRSTEISVRVSVDESEIIDEYIRMQRRIFARIIILDNQQDARVLAEASDQEFSQLKSALGQGVISQEPAKWWLLGDLPQYLEQPLFSLKAGERTVVKFNDDWAVIMALKEEEIEIEPYKNLAAEIKNNIRNRKKEIILQSWIEDLKTQASIKVDHKVLNKINLQ